MPKRLKPSSKELVSGAIANSRLAGFNTHKNTVEVMVRIAEGDMSVEELEVWEN